MNPYLIGLHEWIVRFVADGGTVSEASRKFRVCYKTERYVSKAKGGAILRGRAESGVTYVLE